MDNFNKKINEHFTGLVVRKDLVKTVKGNAIVPTYVLEYLLGQYCATSDEASIQSGITTVKEILRKHYVHRNEAGLIRSIIKEKRQHKVIDKISVHLNDKKDCYEATFSNLGIKNVLVDTGMIKKHPKLLVSGIWCIANMEYQFSEDKTNSPWLMTSLKPIQLSYFNLEEYLEKRKKFSSEEWLDLIIQSMGFNPEMFSLRSKMLQITRLIPYCERNYNLIELGPKGTGKSHIYSEFSPHGILISGGEVTVPKLFVNNSSGKIGLVGFWDTVAFDEFAGKKKKPNKALVDIMKNYMANKSFSRGVEMLGAEASMVFIGNTKHTLPYMLKHSDLFDELPESYYDSAFLDRLHMYLPGWEVDIIRADMFSSGYGFVVDYLAEGLKTLRSRDYSQIYKKHFNLLSDISTRDRDGIHKTFSGLMKILYPCGEATASEIEQILKFAIEGRKRVKDQLMKIDSTYVDVKFGYTLSNGDEVAVNCLEEDQYPQYFNQALASSDDKQEIAENTMESDNKIILQPLPKNIVEKNELEEKHIVIKENQRGISFDNLFGEYLRGSKKIIITDPYIRKFHQAKNLMELLETIIKVKPIDEEVEVLLITTHDDYDNFKQSELLYDIQQNMNAAGIIFNYDFDESGHIHARHIVSDNGWKISLDRGLDIFQRYDMNDPFSVANKMQEARSCLPFEVTYVRVANIDKKG